MHPENGYFHIVLNTLTLIIHIPIVHPDKGICIHQLHDSDHLQRCTYLTNAWHNSTSWYGTLLNVTCHRTLQSQISTCHRKNSHKTYCLQNGTTRNPLLPVPFCLSCSASNPVLPFLFCLPLPVFPILPVPICLSGSDLSFRFCVSGSAFPVLPFLFWLSHAGCPFLAILFFLSCPGYVILAVLCWEPCPGSSFLATLSWQSCSGSPVLSVLLP